MNKISCFKVCTFLPNRTEMNNDLFLQDTSLLLISNNMCPSGKFTSQKRIKHRNADYTL